MASMSTATEERMRVDFDRYITHTGIQREFLWNNIGDEDTAYESIKEALRIGELWQGGPHQDQWGYLCRAHQRYSSQPRVTKIFHTWMAKNRNPPPDYDVRRRSLDQALVMTQPQQVKEQEQRQERMEEEQ